MIEKQFKFIEILFDDFEEDFKQNRKNQKATGARWNSKNYMNKNFGKYALKRKITCIRQELLNLEKMLENE